jgi:glycosyltransferase involved in cell wall biosynthesis
MRLAIVSHKVCYRIVSTSGVYHTDGGFPLQVQALSELFDETSLVVPIDRNQCRTGLSEICGKNVTVRELSRPMRNKWQRRVTLPLWIAVNIWTICKAIRNCDAVHTPIPGDIGTIGLIAALIMQKPLFVRHCGNWTARRTLAERGWRRIIESFAGGRNVMLATGGSNEPPSKVNRHIKWIFSTSLLQSHLEAAQIRKLPADGKIRLMIACRQEPLKGTEIVIRSLPAIRKRFADATLDIAGDGSLLPDLRKLARDLGVAQCVCFHGRVAQSRVIELMRDSHVFCFPTSASEGFPKVVLEALASGLPVITSRVSVLPQLLKNGCGVLLSEPTCDALVKAVYAVCEKQADYEHISSKAIEVAQQYSLEQWRDTIADHLTEAWKVDSLASELHG